MGKSIVGPEQLLPFVAVGSLSYAINGSEGWLGLGGIAIAVGAYILACVGKDHF